MALDQTGRQRFLKLLNDDFGPDEAQVETAIGNYRRDLPELLKELAGTPPSVGGAARGPRGRRSAGDEIPEAVEMRQKLDEMASLRAKTTPFALD